MKAREAGIAQSHVGNIPSNCTNLHTAPLFRSRTFVSLPHLCFATSRENVRLLIGERASRALNLRVSNELRTLYPTEYLLESPIAPNRPLSDISFLRIALLNASLHHRRPDPRPPDSPYIRRRSPQPRLRLEWCRERGEFKLWGQQSSVARVRRRHPITRCV